MGFAYNWRMKKDPDALVLFSAGLDSILAAKLLQEQGLEVLCLHFTSPFFGNAAKIPHWEEIWNLKIIPVDLGTDFCELLCKGPAHGFGSIINPCVDCKIMMLSKAHELLEQYNAKFIATGEVIGQRPMSQRRDSMDTIQNKAQVKGLLLRPLCAQHLQSTPMEDNGLVKRELLGSISGRGRNAQMNLAHEFLLKEIPAPAGGCLLTEKENARRCWQIIKSLRQKNYTKEEMLAAFKLLRLGRQMWLPEGDNKRWLCIGRNSKDNQELRAAIQAEDCSLKLCDFSGPLALAKEGKQWSEEALYLAAQLLASYSKDALKAGQVKISIQAHNEKRIIWVKAKQMEHSSYLPSWEETKKEIKDEQKRKI